MKKVYQEALKSIMEESIDELLSMYFELEESLQEREQMISFDFAHSSNSSELVFNMGDVTADVLNYSIREIHFPTDFKQSLLSTYSANDEDYGISLAA
ncbi:hypothetical protein [Aquitalea sp. LB_tupeE]|uniref:hypothetical protein n=1 Tax=Aquitalea sp. LB_tupeE TaxID=2748078 RepID=UPI0015BFD541|nr:hypothetical protein [Aquitalea sp. LB_tupeE]NWK80323.1 hypothetical protein [Aquitalea sp. LB_tupeE]